jgi:NADH-quinone oxidoreductase subunit L
MVMTLPLVVLGIATVFGGWLNLPAITGDAGAERGFLGPIGALHHWLEPVVSQGALLITHGAEPHLPHTTEYYLIGAAVAVGLLGILLAVFRLKPARLVRKRDARAEEGFERVLVNKYYVDEFYDRTVVSPTVRTSRNLLWRGIDAGLIDGAMVNGSAWLARGMGWVGGMLQSGQTGTYAWVLVIGVLAVLGAFTFR